MAAVIEATGLTKAYGPRRGIVDVDFAVAEGEIFGFLGPNGAGKTTTIRLLLGFLRPTAGRARAFGLDCWRDAPAVHRRTAYAASDPGYLGDLTAGEHLDYLAVMRGLARGCWRPIAERLLLDPTVHVRKLSRGNRQKIGVVQVFMGREPLLVMDEPSSGLDPLMQREFLALVAEAHVAGRTTFLSSHNLPEVERTCGRVAVMRDGRIVDVSTVGQLRGEHWRSVNLLLAAPPPPRLFELPNVEVVAAAGRELHLLVRGDVNPLLQRIAALDVQDIAISTPDIEDVLLRFYEGPAAAPAAAGPEGAAGGAGGAAAQA